MGCKKYWNFQMNHCGMTPKAGFCSNIVHNGANLLLAFCQQIDRPLEDGQTCKKQKRRHIDTQAAMLNTRSEIIQATEVEKLLGYEVHQNLGFGTFLGKLSFPF